MFIERAGYREKFRLKSTNIHDLLRFKYGFLIILLSFILVSCSSGYVIEDGKVYHRSYNSVKWGATLIEIEEADANSFEIIPNKSNVDIGKDKHFVFRKRSIIEGADPKTFEHVNKYYWKDFQSVYNIRSRAHNSKIKGADPSTFKVLNGLWSKDNYNVFYFIEKLDDANPNAFVSLNNDFGKDNEHYYWHEFIIDGLDYTSASVINDYYIKDNNNVFFENKIVPGCDPKTFVVRGAGFFGHDRTYEYSFGKNEGPITDMYREKYIDN